MHCLVIGRKYISACTYDCRWCCCDSIKHTFLGNVAEVTDSRPKLNPGGLRYNAMRKEI